MEQSATLFEVRALLWDTLREHLKAVEWGEIKDILGKKLIDENEVRLKSAFGIAVQLIC